MPKGIRTPNLSLRESHGRVFYYPLKSSKILDFTGFFKIIVLIISLIKSANFMPYFSFILANAKIFWGHHSVNMILVTSVILQLSSFFKWFIRRLILLYRCSLSVSSYIQILKGQVFRLHILSILYSKSLTVVKWLEEIISVFVLQDNEELTDLLNGQC